MERSITIPSAKAAILTIAEIKDAIAAFDRGEANVWAVVDAILNAVEAYGVADREAPARPKPRRKAA